METKQEVVSRKLEIKRLAAQEQANYRLAVKWDVVRRMKEKKKAIK